MNVLRFAKAPADGFSEWRKHEVVLINYLDDPEYFPNFDDAELYWILPRGGGFVTNEGHAVV